MTVLEAIELAIAQGYQIEYRVRKDRGVRVTKVNGKSFNGSSSKGNEFVRNIVGAKLSTKQKKALKKSGKLAKSKGVTKKQTEAFRKLNKAREKVGLKKIKKGRFIENRKKRGNKAAEEMLSNMKKAIKYKLDFAYVQNIAGFVSQLDDALVQPNKVGETYDFHEVRDLIEDNIKYISETALQSGIVIMYLWLNGEIDGDTAKSQMLVEFKLEADRLREVEQEILEE